MVCCILIIVLLLALLIKIGGKDDKTSELEKELAMLRENYSSESRNIISRIDSQSESMRSAADRQMSRESDFFEKMRGEIKELREDTDEGIGKLNNIVSEKMRDTMDKEFGSIVENISRLGHLLSTSQENQRNATTESIKSLEEKFNTIRRDLTESMDRIREENNAAIESMRKENKESLDSINATVNEKMQKTLNDRISQSFETVNKRLAEVYQGLGEMKNVASGVNDLKNVLSNVKRRGILGEIQLSAVLSDILSPEQYEEQFRLDPKSSERVDFAVKLPGREEGKNIYLPIDSKFPGDAYANLAEAYDSGDAAEIKEKRAALEREIKTCAKSIQSKYIVPPYTTDFAIMFLPFEGLYAEVVNMGLVEVLQRDHKVNITGPSTMAAMLNSLQMGFKTLAIQKKSGEVWNVLAAAKKEFESFEKTLGDTRKRLQQADEELEKLVGTRTRMINSKLKSVSALESAEDAAKIIEN